MDNPSPRSTFQQKAIQTAILEFFPPFPHQTDRDSLSQILEGMGFCLTVEIQEIDALRKHQLIFETAEEIDPNFVHEALKGIRNLLRFTLILR